MPPKKQKQGPKKVYDYSGLEKGMRVQADSGGTYYAAEVVQVSESKNRAKAPVKISYKGYEGYDEWVGGDRLRSKALKISTEAKKKKSDSVAAKPKYKLLYFDARGVMEVGRFMFAVAKVDYEEERFPFSFGTPGDMSTIQRPEFDKAKAEGRLDPAMGKVPILYVNDVPIPQSKAIERFLAKKFRMLGKSPVDAAQIDAICEHVRDIKDSYQAVKRTPDAEKEAAIKKFFDEGLPEHCAKLEKSLPTAGGPFLFGNKISLADLTVFQFLFAPKGFFDEGTKADAAKAAIKSCPRLSAACEAVAANSEVQAWVAKRADTMM